MGVVRIWELSCHGAFAPMSFDRAMTSKIWPVTGVALIAIGVAWLARPATPMVAAGGLPASVVAVGAKAWAETRCGGASTVKANAPAAMSSDDLLTLAGAFDAESSRIGIQNACAKAITAAGGGYAHQPDAARDAGWAVAFRR